jgi:hypothetical protein
MIMHHVEIHYGPKARNQKLVRSATTPLYQAMNYSIPYA